MERNIDDYKKDMESLVSDTSTKGAMEILLRRKERIFYCEVDNSFVSIRRTNCEPINNLIKRQIPKEVRIEELLVEIDALNRYLCERSASSFDPIPTRIEELLGDHRLVEIRENYEVKIVERFVENYMKAFKDFTITDKLNDSITGKPTFIICFVDSESTYRIRNWSCTCN